MNESLPSVLMQYKAEPASTDAFLQDGAATSTILYLNPGANVYAQDNKNVQAVATHELGHTIGLADLYGKA